MKQLSNIEKEQIKTAIANGKETKRAIADFLYSEAVVNDCLGIPAFAELSKIDEIEADLDKETPALTDDSADAIKIETVVYQDAANHPEFNAEEAAPGEPAAEPTGEKTVFTDAELFELIAKANKENKTIAQVITESFYGENADAGIVNIRKVAYVKGLVTKLVNENVAEIKAEETPKVAETEAKPTEETKPDVVEADVAPVQEPNTATDETEKPNEQTID